MTRAADFDPWTCTADQAEAARRSWHGWNGPDPLAQRAAALEVLGLQQRCSAGDGRAIMRAVAACAGAGLACPSWLAGAFGSRVDRVARAETGSWDEAFGQPWPGCRGKRLAAKAKELREISTVHAQVWRLSVTEADMSIGRELFAQIAEQPGMPSAGTVRERYYAALAAGKPNPSDVRSAYRRNSSEST